MLDLDLSDDVARYDRAKKGCSSAPMWVTSLAFDARGERLAVGALGAGRVFEFDPREGVRTFEYDVRDVIEQEYGFAVPGGDETFDQWGNDGVYFDAPVFTPDGRHLVVRLNALVDNGGSEQRAVVVFASRGARVWSRSNYDESEGEPIPSSPWAVSRGGAWLAQLRNGNSVTTHDLTNGVRVGKSVRLSSRDLTPGGFGETLAFRDDRVLALASRGVCLIDVDARKVVARHALPPDVEGHVITRHVLFPREGGVWLAVEEVGSSSAWAWSVPRDAPPDAPLVRHVKLPRDATLIRYDEETDESLWWRSTGGGDGSLELVRVHAATGRIMAAPVPDFEPPGPPLAGDGETGDEPPFEIHPPGIAASPDGTRLAFVTATGVRVVASPEQWGKVNG